MVSIRQSPELVDFLPALKEAADQRNGLPLTVVLEVERGCSSPEVLSLVKQVSKVFALRANVLIVLSEANAVLGFGEDDRQKFIMVHEMDRVEAEQYVKKRVPTISQSEFNRFADAVGTLPLSLCLFCDALLAGETTDSCINKKLALAWADLVAFLHQPILAALKKSPGGVSVKIFAGQKHEGVLLSAPKKVAVAMKESNAIIYNFEKQQYQLFSKAYETALKTYEIPPSSLT